MNGAARWIVRRDGAVLDRQSRRELGRTFRLDGEWAAATADGRVFFGAMFGRAWAVEQLWKACGSQPPDREVGA